MTEQYGLPTYGKDVCRNCGEVIHLVNKDTDDWCEYADSLDGNGNVMHRRYIYDCGFLHEDKHQPASRPAQQKGTTMTEPVFKVGDRVKLDGVRGETRSGGPWMNGQPGVITTIHTDGRHGYSGERGGLVRQQAYGIRFDGFKYNTEHDCHTVAETILMSDEPSEEDVEAAIESIRKALEG